VIGTTCSYACTIHSGLRRLGANVTRTFSGRGCFRSRRATTISLLPWHGSFMGHHGLKRCPQKPLAIAGAKLATRNACRELYRQFFSNSVGSVLSPVLANMTLDGLEKLLREKYPLGGEGCGKGRKAKVHMVRYADDFIITGSSQELLEDAVKPLVTSFMQERGLELSQEKTRITHIADGFDFLGQNIRKYSGKSYNFLEQIRKDNGTLYNHPSKKNVKAFLKDIRETIKGHKQATAYNLIAMLNPKIVGWANYHRHSAASKTFSHVDWAIERALWRWIKRRHPKKSTRWMQKKYFCQIGDRNWCFFGSAVGKDGQTVQKVLSQASKTPIERHTKIIGECNPYDPTWKRYLSDRREKKMGRAMKRHLLELWKKQEGLCPMCNQPITEDTGWDNHHIVHKTKGGSNKAENRALVHPNCHKQVHAKKGSVSKPCPV